MFDAQVNGTTIVYETCGEGDPLLLIHGAIVSHQEWIPQLEAFGKSFRLILPDVRGHGKSGQSSAPYSIRQFADDMIALMDVLKIERCFVLGHSMGGMIGLEMAANYPQRVRGLVLADSIYGLHGNPKLRLKVAISSLIIHVMGLERLKQKSAQQLAANFPEAMPLFEEAYAPHLANPANFWNLRAASLRYDGRAQLKRIQCPTLVLIAANNPATHAAGHVMAQTIRRAELVMIPDAKHGLNWDNPSAFNTAVIEFLEKVVHGHETN